MRAGDDFVKTFNENQNFYNRVVKIVMMINLKSIPVFLKVNVKTKRILPGHFRDYTTYKDSTNIVSIWGLEAFRD